MPHELSFITRMPHNYHQSSYQPAYLTGACIALLGRNCKTGDAGASISLSLLFLISLFSSLSSIPLLSISLFSILLSTQSRALSALPFPAGCSTQCLLLWPNCMELVHFFCFRLRFPFLILCCFGR